jgi:hypothetical protein
MVDILCTVLVTEVPVVMQSMAGDKSTPRESFVGHPLSRVALDPGIAANQRGAVDNPGSAGRARETLAGNTRGKCTGGMTDGAL